MKIGIIRSGQHWSALAGHFQKLRHSVLIANSRSPETLSQVAQKTALLPLTCRRWREELICSLSQFP